MVHSHPAKLTPARWLLTWTLMTVAAPHAAATGLGAELSWGGNLAVTSDYIYRGVSESNGRAALQADVHADTEYRRDLVRTLTVRALDEALRRARGRA